METRIQVLEKFSSWTKVLPYLGFAHNSFLLLSRMSKRSRVLLDEHYEGIINWLSEFIMNIHITEQNINALFLPSDLFQFSISLKTEKAVKIFANFISQLQEKKGYYYKESKFMHDNLKISSCLIDVKYINILYLQIDFLKTLKILQRNYQEDSRIWFQDSMLIEQIRLLNANNFILKYKHFDFLSEFDNEELSITEHIKQLLFQRVNMLYLDASLIENTKSIVQSILNWNLIADTLVLTCEATKEYEELTDPMLYKEGETSIIFKISDF